MKKQAIIGRPPVITEKTVVAVTSGAAKTKLQDKSDRRSVVNRIIDEGGSQSLQKLNEHYGYDVRNIVLALLKLGWLSVVRP